MTPLEEMPEKEDCPLLAVSEPVKKKNLSINKKFITISVSFILLIILFFKTVTHDLLLEQKTIGPFEPSRENASVAPLAETTLVLNITHPWPLSTCYTCNQESPSVYLPNSLLQETIHLTVMLGLNPSSYRLFETMLKSILNSTQNHLQFHLIVDSEAHDILKKKLIEWNFDGVSISFYNVSSYAEKVAWIHDLKGSLNVFTHPAGILPLMKLIMTEILPQSINKVIALDADLIFLTDIAELWSYFNFMSGPQALGLATEQSCLYKKPVPCYSDNWPSLGDGVNTGVALMDLTKLRNFQFVQRWKIYTEEIKKKLGAPMIAEQSVINAFIVENPQIVFNFPPIYNVQFGSVSSPEPFISKARILHFCGAKKPETQFQYMLPIIRLYEDITNETIIAARNRSPGKAAFQIVDDRFQKL